MFLKVQGKGLKVPVGSGRELKVPEGAGKRFLKVQGMV